MRTFKKSEQFPGPPFGGDPIIKQLLKEAIDKELTEIQCRTLCAVWFDGKTVKDVAQKDSVSEQTVRRRLKQSCGKLRNALRYAVRYAQLRSLSEEV
jgi:DNA-directed RNA polymerase specialized sigma24 family protein